MSGGIRGVPLGAAASWNACAIAPLLISIYASSRSKAFLLAQDKKIRDEAILTQIQAK
jgi:hypothetical protein